MRIFIIDTYYDDFLKDFYTRHPHLVTASYQQQKDALLAEQFGTADFYSKNFRALGYDAEEFIINCEPLQKQWAHEHEIRYRKEYFQSIPRIRYYFRSNWLPKITEAQIESFAPNVIYTQDINNTDINMLKRMKKKFHCLLVAQIATRLPEKKRFEPYDLVISSLPNIVQQVRAWGKRAEYLPLAFEPSILNHLPLPKKGEDEGEGVKFDLTHVGGYGPIHDERNAILEAVAQKIRLDCWGYGIENLAPDSPLRAQYHGQSWGVHMYNILYNSKITLTKHITQVANGYANNMTLYEATGCGTLLITDWKENLPGLFEPGKEIETYRTAEELIEKIKYYLTHENERARIAAAGQNRTLKEHTYAHRVKTLLHMFQKL